MHECKLNAYDNIYGLHILAAVYSNLPCCPAELRQRHAQILGRHRRKVTVPELCHLLSICRWCVQPVQTASATVLVVTS